MTLALAIAVLLLALAIIPLWYVVRQQARSIALLRERVAALDIRVGTIAGKVDSPGAKVVDTKKLFL